MVAIVPQAHYDRVGRIVGKIFSANLDEKDVYSKFTSRSTWQNVKKGFASDETTERILGSVEAYVDGVLEEKRKR